MSNPIKVFPIVVLLTTAFFISFGQHKPNIIVIYADDLGYADLTCQGSAGDVQTPNIDLLAKGGIRCTEGYVTAPQCSPSRAGLLTGRYQQRFGFDAIADGPLPLSEITIANRLSKAGYVTGQVGKWHLEPNPATLKWVKKNIPGAKPQNGRYNKIPDSMLIPYMPGARGFDQYYTGYINSYRANYGLKGNLLKPGGENIVQAGYRLDIQTDAALQFIQRNHQKPFFLYLAYFAPHVPLEATRKYLDRFPGKMPERRRYALAMISAMDDGVGRITTLLREYGIDDNTVIIFASDNGAPLGITKEDVPVTSARGIWDGSLNDPLLGEKGMLSEGGIRVPFIIRWSKLPQGVLFTRPVSSLDIASTALSLAGLKKTKDMDGVDLLPYLTGRKTKAPHAYLFWRFWDQSAVRSEKWKFINAGNKAAYLFDMKKDPEERNNLISREPAVAKKLRRKLQDWTKGLMPPGIPYKNLNNQESGWYDHYFRKYPVDPGYDSLQHGFSSPPDSIKPFVYWYWINDNISGEGITKDLEAMARIGIGEAFIGNIGLPGEPYGKVKAFSDEWWRLTEHAIREGKRLGVNIGMFNSPGWSQSGGPWIRPSEAMRYLVSSDTLVTGGKPIRVKLSIPKDTFQDLKVLAFPEPLEDGQTIGALGPDISINGQAKDDGKLLVDGSLKTALSLPVRDGKVTIDLVLHRPFVARSLLLYPSRLRFRCTVELKKAEAGKFSTVRRFIFDRSNDNQGVGPMPSAPVAMALDESMDSIYRLTFSNINVTGGKSDTIALAEIQLSTAPRLEQYIEKQLDVMYQSPLPYWKEYQWVTQAGAAPDRMYISSGAVMDISDKMTPDGILQWTPPKGNWIISRIGLAPTGTKNHPVSPEAEGLEVDKMSKPYLAHHFDAYIGEILRRMPPGDRTAFHRVVADSYEMGPENWTEGFQDDFIWKYHYDPMPYLPVINGRIVNSAAQSDRFLWDMRRLIADKVAYDYVGGLRKLSEKNGMRVWLENYGHWGFPSEFLMYGGQSNDIGGEFWAEGALGNVECKAASSAAHTYGINRVYAESYTAAGKSFERYPAYLKKRGDWSFTEGINHVLLHVYIHQPYEDKNPGMNAWFGTEFNRKNTWFQQAKPWIDYQRRCMFLLQQGKPVADVCYFIGEDAPKMTGIRDPALPRGYSFDYINAEVIMNRLQVKDGLLVLPDGMNYRMMVLPPLETMRPELLEKIVALVRAGATILGPRPVRSPSLQDYPAADAKVREMAGLLWGDIDGKSIRSHPFGKGLVLDGIDMQTALNKIHVKKDFDIVKKDPAIAASAPVLFTHRKTATADIYFITNQSDTLQDFTAIFRAGDKQPELWDAINGEARDLPVFSTKEGMTEIPLRLFPAQSYFILFRRKIAGSASSGNFPRGEIIKVLDSPWRVTFDTAMRGPRKPVLFRDLTDWIRNENDSIKYYSGQALYETSFEYDGEARGRWLLDLGNVKDLAAIELNGKEVGGLWTAPWQIDISAYLRKGENRLSVKIVNLWVNRLIGDAGLPAHERKTWASVNKISKTDPLHSSGLLGPVHIVQVQ